LLGPQAVRAVDDNFLPFSTQSPLKRGMDFYLDHFLVVRGRLLSGHGTNREGGPLLGEVSCGLTHCPPQGSGVGGWDACLGWFPGWTFIRGVYNLLWLLPFAARLLCFSPRFSTPTIFRRGLLSALTTPGSNISGKCFWIFQSGLCGESETTGLVLKLS